MSKKFITVTFERNRFSKAGRITEHEEVSVNIQPSEDCVKEIDRAYAALFDTYPDWGNGLPAKNGIGFSSASIKR